MSNGWQTNCRCVDLNKLSSEKRRDGIRYVVFFHYEHQIDFFIK